jgi:hypothetical protein
MRTSRNKEEEEEEEKEKKKSRKTRAALHKCYASHRINYSKRTLRACKDEYYIKRK